MLRFCLFGLSLITAGCCSTPGFRVTWEFYSPPSINQNTVLAPMPAAPTTAYLAEAPSATPVQSRQYYTAAAPVPAQQAPVTPFQPQRQLLPMPRETMPKASVCDPSQCAPQ